jgi:hypothetical protein
VRHANGGGGKGRNIHANDSKLELRSERWRRVVQIAIKKRKILRK